MLRVRIGWEEIWKQIEVLLRILRYERRGYLGRKNFSFFLSTPSPSPRVTASKITAANKMSSDIFIFAHCFPGYRNTKFLASSSLEKFTEKALLMYRGNLQENGSPTRHKSVDI